MAKLSIEGSQGAAVAFMVTWLAAGLAFSLLGRVGIVLAVGLGLLAAGLHWFVLMIHQLGHAVAAMTTGYPMSGVRLWWWLAASLYPEDEPELGARIHITRALGGPMASLILALIGFFFARLFGGQSPLLRLLALVVAFDSFFVFGIGALLPLGFTDGSTLLRWWPPASTSD